MEKMELPDILKTSLMENNTAETYRYLAVSTFAEYIADSLAVMIVNGISFLLSFIISAIVIRLLSYILNVLTNLPAQQEPFPVFQSWYHRAASGSETRSR